MSNFNPQTFKFLLSLKKFLLKSAYPYYNKSIVPNTLELASLNVLVIDKERIRYLS